MSVDLRICDGREDLHLEECATQADHFGRFEETDHFGRQQDFKAEDLRQKISG